MPLSASGELAGLGERSLAFGRGVAELGVEGGWGTRQAVGEEGFAAGIEDASAALEEALYGGLDLVQLFGRDDRIGHDEGGVLGVDLVEIFFRCVPALHFVAELTEQKEGCLGSGCAAVVNGRQDCFADYDGARGC